MKRDLDLVRKILMEIEKKEESMGWIIPEIESYSENEIFYHIKILEEAGFIEAKDLSTLGTFEWAAINLTWEGHEFLDASRNETIWKKSKSIIQDKMGSASFDVLKSLLFKTAATQLGL
jgi:repressor of nif and glnA expression